MAKRIAAVVTCTDSWEAAFESIDYLMQNSTPELTEVILLNNGSWKEPPEDPVKKWGDNFAFVQFGENLGANGVFHHMLPVLSKFNSSWPEKYNFDIVAYFHNDMMIREQGWDERVAFAFDLDPKLALAGFLGSNAIDGLGGRGLGTSSSFMGYEYASGHATKAEIHGRRVIGTEAAAVVDHCSMIFRVSMLYELPAQAEAGYAPHHFYDRILSCEVLNRGWHIAMIGIECDHFGGGTGLGKLQGPGVIQYGVLNREENYKKWLAYKGMTWVEGENLDAVVYKEAEKIFLSKWRDDLHFIPVKVAPDYTLQHGAQYLVR